MADVAGKKQQNFYQTHGVQNDGCGYELVMRWLPILLKLSMCFVFAMDLFDRIFLWTSAVRAIDVRSCQF